MESTAKQTRLQAAVAAAGLAAALVLTYAGSLDGGFLWDDDLHITANPTIIGPLGLKEIWTSARANYFPLTLTSFWLQHAAWGLEPLGYRLVTLACHLGAAFLLWRVLVRLRVPGAWLGAALWAVHPVQAESVAWICELKNTQSAVFFLAAILCHLRWLGTAPGGGRMRWYWAALGCALLAILSKPSTVMLPVVLGLLGWWKSRRLEWREWLPLAPFLTLSAVAAAWTIWEQRHNSGALGPEWGQTFPERLVIAGRAITFYLGKLAWPEPLTFIYPRWRIAADGPGAFLPLIGVTTLLGMLWLGRRRPSYAACFLAAACFGALLFPVLGFFNVYFFRYSFVGDHFQYLASMAPLALVASALAGATSRHGALPRAVGAAALLAVPAFLTSREAREYRDNETLWRATLADNPGAIMAWLNLGDTYVKAGHLEEAVATFSHVTRIKPDDFDAYNDLGGALLQLGRDAEALVALERAAAFAPARADILNNLGTAQRRLGRTSEARENFRRALAADPTHAEAHNSLGVELADAGDTAGAIRHFEDSLRANPRNVAALNNLGHALRSAGRPHEAVARHREASRLQPDFPDALAGLGLALVLSGQPAEGLPVIRRSVALAPADPAVRGLAGRALAAAGSPAEAVAHFARAAELMPDSADARLNLGSALGQAGRDREAVVAFSQAVRLAPRMTAARVSLGNSLGAIGRWQDAVTQFEAAVKLAPAEADLRGRLGIARVNAGRPAEAVGDFEEAIRLRPDVPEMHEQFAQVLRALGRNAEALARLERAAELRRPGAR